MSKTAEPHGDGAGAPPGEFGALDHPDGIFAKLFRCTPDAFVVTAVADGRVFAVNDNFHPLSGYAREEVVGRTTLELGLWANPAERERLVTMALRDGRVADFEFVLRAKAGALRTCLITVELVPLQNGLHFLCLVRDVSQRRQEERRAHLWQQVFEAAEFAIAWTSPVDNTFVDVNPACARERGYTRTELIGQPILKIYAPEVIPAMRERMRNIDQDGHLAFESVHLRKDGTRFPVLVEVTTIRDALGCPIARVAYAVDITKRKQTEVALQASATQSQALFEGHSAVQLIVDPETGAILGANAAAAAFYGWSTEELRRMTVKQLNTLPPEAVAQELAKAAAAKRVHFEFRHRRADGSFRDVEVFSNRISMGEKGVLYSIIHDITERREATMALRESELRFRAVFTHAADAYVVLADGIHVDCNDAALALMRVERPAFIGTSPLAFSPEFQPDGSRSAEQAAAYIQEVHAAGHKRFEWLHRRPDGTEIWVEVVATAIALVGKPAVLGAWRDVTERKSAEKFHELNLEVLLLLSHSGQMRDCLDHVAATVRTRMGMDAVGIRVKEGEDFPYFSQVGFPDDFLRAERSLLSRGKEGWPCRDAEGQVRLECTCGMILSGKIDPANPLLSPGGSIWTNDTLPFLKVPAEQDSRFRPRNRCIHYGYASIALVPLRANNRTVGLLQLNSFRKGQFSPKAIQALEDLGRSIGEALRRKQAEEALQRRTAELEARNEELSRFNRLTVGRELQMIELKQEINQLCRAAGQPERYGTEAAAREASGRPSREQAQQAEKVAEEHTRLTQAHAAALNLMQDVVAARDRTESANRALRASEERMRSLIASMSDLVFVLDSSLAFQSFHQPRNTSLFLPPDQFVGRRFDEIGFPEPAAGDIKAALAQTLRTGEPSKVEYAMDLGTGRSWFDLRVTPFANPDGNVMGLTCVVRDVSAMRRRETLSAARARLLELATRQPLNEVLRATLDEAEAITGSRLSFYHELKPDQVTLELQMWSTNTLQHMCRAEGAGRYYSVVQAGVGVDCVRERRPVVHNDYATLAHRKGLPPGHAEFVRQVVVPVMRGDKIAGIIGVGNKAVDYGETDVEMLSALADLAWDIVEHKRMDEELRQFNVQLEQKVAERTAALTQEMAERRHIEEGLRLKNLVFDSSLSGTSIADLAGRLTEVNGAFLKIWGYANKAEVLGRTIPEFFANPDEAIAILAALSRDGTWEGVYVGKKADGSSFQAYGLATTVRDQRGELIGYQSAVNDISQRVEAEKRLRETNLELKIAVAEAGQLAIKAQAATVAKSRFLANMSHEIRTPLNAIIGFSALLRDDAAIPPRQKQRVETISRSGEHLLELLNDVLDISKIEAGAEVLSPANCDLRVLLGDLALIFRQRAEVKDLTFASEGLDTVLKHIIADSKKLRQVLYNLLGNAVKFTTSGGVCLRAETRRAETGDSHRLIIWVEDSGPGIPANEIEKLFQTFEQTSAGRIRDQGTGLGLAISRQLARLMGGDITVASDVGRGSVFTVEVPVRAAPAAPAEAAVSDRLYPASGARLEAGQAPLRVLVVDDIASNRNVLFQVLEEAGVEASAVGDGREAVEAFSRVQPHLILMDHRMPGMDGAEAIRRIRGTAEGARVKIITLTASTEIQSREQALRAGADEFLAKPFRRSELFEMIGRLVGVRFVATPLSAAPPEVNREQQVALAATRLAAFPAETRARMAEAAIRGRHNLLLELEQQLPDDKPAEGDALRGLILRFDYESILTLLKDSPP